MNTGPRGLNRRFHGICKALSEQAKDANYSPEDAKSDLKWLATADGYPMVERRVKLRGKVVKWLQPESWAGQSNANALIAITVAQVFADERNLYLYEYDEDEKPFRSIGGRSLAEMGTYIAQLRAEGKEDEARRLEYRPKWKYRGEP